MLSVPLAPELASSGTHHSTKESQGHDFCVSPPHAPPESLCSSTERHALICCLAGAVHEKLNTLSSR